MAMAVLSKPALTISTWERISRVLLAGVSGSSLTV